MTVEHALLFVCLGNICRSPLAEGIFLHRATARGGADRFLVDSCGMGAWHVGNRPDPRAEATAAMHGVTLPSCARQFDRTTDPERFGLILAMDASNARALIERGAPTDAVRLMRSFDPTLRHLIDDNGMPKPGADLDVPDPYYGGDRGFHEVYDMLVRACDGLLDELA